MLAFSAFCLILAWLLGLISTYTMGGLIHLLLVGAVIMVSIQVGQIRRRIKLDR